MTRSSIRILLSLLAVLVLGAGVAACGGDDEETGTTTPASTQPGQTTAGELSATEKAANKIEPVEGASGVTLKVGSKNFTEQYILGEIYAQALRAAGYRVSTDLDLGSELIAYRALRRGAIDAYPEYTGTALTSFFDVKIEDVPKDPAQAYADAREAYAKAGVTALPPTPFENTYRMAVTKQKAAELGNPTTISDLQGKAQDMVVNGFPECRQRIDCLLGVERGYDLKFKRFLPGENKFQILDNGDADIAFVFTTDGPLASGKYVVLDDDKSIFPPYNITFTVREQAARRMGADGHEVVTNVQRYMTEEIMQELNARVDIDKQQPARVAREYLTNFGFIEASSS